MWAGRGFIDVSLYFAYAAAIKKAIRPSKCHLA
jgi:hypothetical protein